MARFQLLSYETSEPDEEERLLDETIRQAGRWEEGLKGQIGPTQILSGRAKGVFKVIALIPLLGIEEFPAIWDGLLGKTLKENITLDLKRGEQTF